ncbi:DUF4388 domain-containing protein [Phormidium sp. FACHB-1136]|uniref:DUF4388 domain-containing protein n=1 Tax=Phormidium sp. FACHB-1136 TaxID=2692848 RepID=UPI00168399BB|nr:DUF4388 domain-containing protein [Phormidium sp. FACHB-1136]MBD2428255.1 DUF4388 domain-containing protein [Phormidium sp. FACHB-1136]
MTVTGYLADFSLPELFQMLEQGSKTGLLTICTLRDHTSADRHNHHIWFSQGQIVAAGNSLDQQGLMRLIAQRGWMGDLAVSRLAQTCQSHIPLGLCLKNQKVLTAEQLKLLFYTQVMRQVCALFALPDGWFQFDPKSPLPVAEMTGLIATATDVTLAGLRALKDWQALDEKLPDPSSALVSVVEGKPNLRLNPNEWQVWEYTKGTMALKEVAQHLNLPIAKTQQIAFRLIVTGLAEEMPMMAAPPPSALDLDDVHAHDRDHHGTSDSNTSSKSGAGAAPISQSFLQNLVGFLKGKV